MLSTGKKTTNIFRWIAVGLTSFVILAVVGYMAYTNGHPLGKF
jgi:uncharacterized membrane protein YukC